ncbi:MAG: hypothetical protein FWC64_04505 [Treponema sp.]|nr:hypothetical protein [Treponema sp.]
MKNKVVMPIAGVALAAALALVLAACNIASASSHLEGRWLAAGGVSIEFAAGSFTQTMPDGSVRSGTFETSGGMLTKHRRGFSPAIEPYSVSFPTLQIGEIRYYHDSPAMPTSVVGIWHGFWDGDFNIMGYPILFGHTTPIRGNRYILEGEYRDSNVRGIYQITARNLPGAHSMHRRPTHAFGGALRGWLEITLPADIVMLFDDIIFEFEGPPEHFWFTIDDVQELFARAAARALTQLQAVNVVHFMERFFDSFFLERTAEYVLLQDLLLNHLFHGVATGYNRMEITEEASLWGVVTIVPHVKIAQPELRPGAPANLEPWYWGDWLLYPDAY